MAAALNASDVTTLNDAYNDVANIDKTNELNAESLVDIKNITDKITANITASLAKTGGKVARKSKVKSRSRSRSKSRSKSKSKSKR